MAGLTPGHKRYYVSFCPLHAAAPELLAALQKLTAEVESCWFGFATEGLVNQMREARAAIAKATEPVAASQGQEATK